LPKSISSDLDPGLTREGAALLRELPRSAQRQVLLATDPHADNVLCARREPWLVIDLKPFVGDPAFDPSEPVRRASMLGGALAA
jgi:streptomycin 6-kinase